MLERVWKGCGVLVLSIAGASAAQDFSDVEIRTTDLGDGVAMLVGQGGNIGLSVGPDGSFLIESMSSRSTSRSSTTSVPRPRQSRSPPPS